MDRNIPPTAEQPPRAPAIIAHRGFSACCPENSLPAFGRALAAHADALECDVRLSADGVPVVIHDATLDRTSDGAGSVGLRSWRDLAALDVGAWFSPRFAGARLPRFAELLALVQSSPTAAGAALRVPRLFVEVKDNEAERPGIVAAVVSEIRAAGLSTHCAIGSFHGDVLVAAAAQAPEIPRHQIVGGPPASWPESPVAVAAINAEARYLDARTLARLHERGLARHVWTVNRPEAVARYAKLGVEGIITDDPAMARQALWDF